MMSVCRRAFNVFARVGPTNHVLQCHKYSKGLNVGRRGYLLLPAQTHRHDEFLNQKLTTVDYIGHDSVGAFHDLMREKLDTDEDVSVENVKLILHSCFNEKEADNAVSVLKRYCQQHSDNRFRFGPVVMRMMHELQLIKKLKTTLLDQDLEEVFNDTTSYNLCMDNLLELGDFTGVLEVFAEMSKKEVQLNQQTYLIAVAACYKLNSAESYTAAQAILEDSQMRGRNLIRTAHSFLMYLAIKQNEPQQAVSVYTLIKNPNYKVCRTLQVMALVELGRFDQAFMSIRTVFQDQPKFAHKEEICVEALDLMQAHLEKINDVSKLKVFTALMERLKDGEHICNETVEKLIFRPQVMMQKSDEFNRPESNNRSYRRRPVDRILS